MPSPSFFPRSIPGSPPGIRTMLNKVPEITVCFWIIKILATTVGETAADYLNSTIGIGLTGTTLIMTGFLIAALIAQFSFRLYVPFVYWLSVVLISVVGTLFSDNLVDNYGIGLPTTTVAFAIALAIVFALWYRSERTLSIHSIVTTRREGFYWLAVLFTFALGTSAGDLTAERLSVGYWQSAVLFAALIAATFIAHIRFRADAILTFWIAYILTRPLGASIGDFLSQPTADGGRGLGNHGDEHLVPRGHPRGRRLPLDHEGRQDRARIGAAVERGVRGVRPQRRSASPRARHGGRRGCRLGERRGAHPLSGAVTRTC